jgi:hypothetical protein
MMWLMRREGGGKTTCIDRIKNKKELNLQLRTELSIVIIITKVNYVTTRCSLFS